METCPILRVYIYYAYNYFLNPNIMKVMKGNFTEPNLILKTK